ncbi:MAG: hypothetical protein Q4B73_07905 [Lachnospiraceae bacterium]|nr:hypothetical protein [Lachnospiraceae bacterium]
MKRRKMVLACTDTLYAGRFLQYMQENESSVPWEWVVFSEEMALRRFASAHEMDVLLMEDDLAGRLLRERANEVIWEKAALKMLLTEHAGNLHGAGWQSISRYQSMPALRRKLLKTYARLVPERGGGGTDKGDMLFVGLYAPGNGGALTELGLALARALAERKRVLYLCTAAYAGFEQRFDCRYERDLSDLLVDLLENHNGLPERLAALVHRVGPVDYLPPMRCFEDVWETPSGVWEELLALIRDQTTYEVLVWDFGQGVRGLKDLLMLCDKVVVPVGSTPHEEAAWRTFAGDRRMGRLLEEERLFRVKAPLPDEAGEARLSRVCEETVRLSLLPALCPERRGIL